jgi:hypothetical protein
MLYLDCSCLNLPLGIFLEFLGFFWVFSVPLNIFCDFPEFILHSEIISEKKNKTYPILLGRARRPTQDRAGPAIGPRGAHLGPAARQQAMAPPPLPGAALRRHARP